MSKPGADPSSGISSVDVLIPTERHPACRQREARPGSCTERENLAGDAKGKDRKSTRLNSSHANISYAVFCLKKKKKKYTALMVPSQRQYRRHRHTCR